MVEVDPPAAPNPYNTSEARALRDHLDETYGQKFGAKTSLEDLQTAYRLAWNVRQANLLVEGKADPVYVAATEQADRVELMARITELGGTPAATSTLTDLTAQRDTLIAAKQIAADRAAADRRKADDDARAAAEEARSAAAERRNAAEVAAEAASTSRSPQKPKYENLVIDPAMESLTPITKTYEEYHVKVMAYAASIYRRDLIPYELKVINTRALSDWNNRNAMLALGGKIIHQEANGAEYILWIEQPVTTTPMGVIRYILVSPKSIQGAFLSLKFPPKTGVNSGKNSRITSFCYDEPPLTRIGVAWTAYYTVPMTWVLTTDPDHRR